MAQGVRTSGGMSLHQTSRIGPPRLIGYSVIETVADDLPGFFGSSLLNLISLEFQQTTEPTGLFPTFPALVDCLQALPVVPVYNLVVSYFERSRVSQKPPA